MLALRKKRGYCWILELFLPSIENSKTTYKFIKPHCFSWIQTSEVPNLLFWPQSSWLATCWPSQSRFLLKQFCVMGKVLLWCVPYCSTSLPLASARWVWLTWSNLCRLFWPVQSINLSKIKRKVLGSAVNLTQGSLVQSENTIQSAMQPPPGPRVLHCWICFKRLFSYITRLTFFRCWFFADPMYKISHRSWLLVSGNYFYLQNQIRN